MTEEMTPTPNFHDIPSTDAIYDTESADAALRKMEADIRKYPNHPYWDKNSPIQQDWLSYQSKLFQIKHQDDDGLTNLQRNMKEGLELKTEQEAERATAAQAAIDELGEYGWGTFDVTELEGGPCLPHELSCLNILLQVEKGEYGGQDGAIAKFDELMTQYPHAPHDVTESLQKLKDKLRDDSADTFNEKRTLSLKILQTMRDYGRAKLNLSPRPDISGGYHDDEY